ncbi:transposase Tn3 family protein [Alicycliphilus sp. B1]|nr:transposase Tn3 family protein [Alicycliphilus sp. B1]
MFFTDERWQAESKKHYAPSIVTQQGCHFLEAFAGPGVTAGVDAVAAAARSGVLRVDDELHLSAIARQRTKTQK